MGVFGRPPPAGALFRNFCTPVASRVAPGASFCEFCTAVARGSGALQAVVLAPAKDGGGNAGRRGPPTCGNTEPPPVGPAWGSSLGCRRGGSGRGGSPSEACKSPKKMHRTPAELPLRYKSPKKVHRPAAGRPEPRVRPPPTAGGAGRTRGLPAVLTCRAQVESRALGAHPPCTGWASRARHPPTRTERRLASRTPARGPRDVLKIDQSVFSGRKKTAIVLKIGQSVFPGRGPQAPGASEQIAGPFTPSEKPQVGRGLSFS